MTSRNSINRSNNQVRTFEMLNKRELFAADLLGASEFAAQASPDGQAEQAELNSGVETRGTTQIVQGDSVRRTDRPRASKEIDRASPLLSSAGNNGHVTVLKARGTGNGHVTVLKARDAGTGNGHVTVLKASHSNGGGLEADNDLHCLQLAFANPPGTAVLDTGVLMVTGTTGADQITIVRDHNNLDVYMNNDVTPIATFLYGDVNEIVVYGGCKDDVITLTQESGSDPIDESALVTVYGGGGDDEIHGTNGDDLIYGGAGDDLIFGYGGADDLFGGTGDDEIHGGSGSDLIDGGAGDDDLYGGHHHDYIFGQSGNDEIWGGWGSDTIDPGTDNPVHVGGGQLVGDIVHDVELFAAPAKLSP